MRSRFAAAAVLAVSLAACGSNDTAAAPDTAAPTAMPSEMPMASASDMPMTGASGMPMAQTSAAPAPSPSASASATPTPSPSATVSAAARVAAADPPEAFKQCSICHQVAPGANSIGPSLAGVVGRKAGTVPGFKYSKAIR